MRALFVEVSAELREGVERDAAQLVDAQKALAPVDQGDLRDGIQSEAYQTSEAVGRLVEARDWKSHFAEFGTEKQAARPFFYPPYRALKRRFKARMTRRLRKAVQKIS